MVLPSPLSKRADAKRAFSESARSFSCPNVRAPARRQAKGILDKSFGALTVSAAPHHCPARHCRFALGGAFFSAGPPVGALWEEIHEIVEKLAMGAALLASASVVSFAAAGEGPDRRRHLVELPGRALEDRRGGDQEALDKHGAKYISADAGLADEAARRRRRPDRQGRQGADRAGDGQGRDPAGGREGERRRHPGDRLRPPDREPGVSTSPSTTRRSAACRRARSWRPSPTATT